MIVSTEWLKQFVDVRESPAELADLLSGIGLDAEFTGIQDNIKGVVIGRVKTAEKHPNADKLSLCTVSDGKNEFQVVCGAPNVAEGQTIAYASVGAILAGNVKIKKGKIKINDFQMKKFDFAILNDSEKVTINSLSKSKIFEIKSPFTI